MRAGLDAQRTEGVGSLDFKGGRFQASLFSVGGVQDRGGVTVAFSPAQIHTQQHLCEVGSIHSTGTGANGNDGLTVIVFTCKQGHDFQICQRLLQRSEVFDRFGDGIGVALVLGQLHEDLKVIDPGFQSPQLFQFGLGVTEFGGDFLRGGGIVPQIR